ncbi:MAG: hypothetical protein ACFFEN_10680 [Candidatus Thorarchaeota archaeon]
MTLIRDAYVELVDFLKEIMFKKGILERPSYMELSKKLGFTYNWIKNKKGTLKAHQPQKKNFDNFYIELTERFKDLLKNSWNTIESKFQQFYNLAFFTDSNLPSTPTRINKSIKRQFFDDIKKIIKKHFPNARIFDRDLSRIFFKRPKALLDSHLKGNYEFRMLDKSTLFSMIYKIRLLTELELINKVRDIKKVDRETLEKIKIDLEKFIESFIFSNPYYDKKYINEKHDTGTEYFKPEFDLTLNIWFNLSKVKKGPILLKHTQKMLKYATFGRLSKGWKYSWDGIMNMLKILITLLPGEEYSKVFEQSWKYIEHRCLYLALPRNYHSSWYALNTVRFHVVLLIIRDLGLDILNLEPIEPEAFKKTQVMESYTFERHHLFINDKQSIDANRLVLVMHMNHNELEGKSDLVLDLIQSRINLTSDCPQYYKNNIKDWKTLWQQYLKRRNYLIENGIENFIRKFFTDEHGNNYILNRFFKNVPKGQIQREIKIMMQEWINKGRPAPILNTYIMKRLFLGTPYLLNSGYIGN